MNPYNDNIDLYFFDEYFQMTNKKVIQKIRDRFGLLYGVQINCSENLNEYIYPINIHQIFYNMYVYIRKNMWEITRNKQNTKSNIINFLDYLVNNIKTEEDIDLDKMKNHKSDLEFYMIYEIMGELIKNPIFDKYGCYIFKEKEMNKNYEEKIKKMKKKKCFKKIYSFYKNNFEYDNWVDERKKIIKIYQLCSEKLIGFMCDFKKCANDIIIENKEFYNNDIEIVHGDIKLLLKIKNCYTDTEKSIWEDISYSNMFKFNNIINKSEQDIRIFKFLNKNGYKINTINRKNKIKRYLKNIDILDKLNIIHYQYYREKKIFCFFENIKKEKIKEK